MLNVPYRNKREDGQRAKELRRQATMPERILWEALSKSGRQAGIHFRRQKPIHPYVVDFACVKAMLAIEIDGFSHEIQIEYDAMRENELRSKGWTVLRFKNSEVKKNLDGVVRTIMEKADELLTSRAHP